MLLDRFLTLEAQRIEARVAAEARQHELDLKRYEIEVKDLERIGEEKRKQMLFEENIRTRKREAMAKAREAKKTKGAQQAANPGQFLLYEGHPERGQCAECIALSQGKPNADHASHLMIHLRDNHLQRFGVQSQN